MGSTASMTLPLTARHPITVELVRVGRKLLYRDPLRRSGQSGFRPLLPGFFSGLRLSSRIRAALLSFFSPAGGEQQSGNGER